MRTAIASAALAAGLLASLAPAPPLSPAGPPAGDAPSSPVRLALDTRPARDGGTTYAITVRNTSGSDAPHGLVTQLLPDALGYVSARPRARTTGRQVTWRLALPAGSSRVLTVTAAPDRTEDNGAPAPSAPRPYDAPAAADAADGVRAAERRADAGDGRPASATTVCFQGGAGGRWLTCTSAGDDWPPESWVSSNKVYAAVSAAAALVVGTAGIVVLRRRRARDTDDDRTPR
ncbi:DUF11 domain-containing protein [Streptomyces sp. MAR4 CNX-425]|uniref:DUF11 domain-containing protein n=1 Tax=Streptomyces sp. MAR4 CNX-425 TaxID=3406343 RepID=UPI003B50D637